MTDLRTRIAAAVATVQAELAAIDIPDGTIPSPICYRYADAVIRELGNPIRGCTDPWHWSTGEPYRCPSCGYWMGEGYV